MGNMYCHDNNTYQVDLGNAIELSKQSGQLVPTFQQIGELQPDDYVELTHEGERFTVKVDEVDISDNTCQFKGVLQDDLQFDHPFQKGDCVIFNSENILNIWGKEWKNKYGF